MLTYSPVLWDARVEKGLSSEILEPFVQHPQSKPQILPSEQKPYQPLSVAQILSEPTEPVSIPKLVYLTELPEANYQLKRPIAVFLEQGQEGWLALRDDLGICACGETVDEAIANFAASLLDDYDLYTSAEPEELSEGARKLAEWLREVIKRT